jgi:hypothetical protein
LPKLPLRSFDGWFTATEGVTKNLLNNPNTVSGWKNLVPGGSDFAQSTSNLQPALTTINGLTALAPDGASGRGAATDVLVEGDMIDNIGTGDFYIAFVISLDALTVGSYAILSKGGTGSYNIEIGGNSKNLAIRVGSSVVFQTDTDSFTETNETYFVEVVRTDGTTICYKNGENIKELTPIYTLAAEGDLSFGRADCKVGEFIWRLNGILVLIQQPLQEKERLVSIHCLWSINSEIDHPHSKFFNIKQLKQKILFPQIGG